MDNRSILACAIAGLAECTMQTRVAALRDTEIQLEEARTRASVECPTRADCDRLWSQTKTYVAQRSVTPIRCADETAIETAEPNMLGAIYALAMRTTDDSGASTISIKGMCRGMYRADGDTGWLYKSCAEQIRAVEMNFRSFVGAS